MLNFQVAGGKYYCPREIAIAAGNPKLLPADRGWVIVAIGEQSLFSKRYFWLWCSSPIINFVIHYTIGGGCGKELANWIIDGRPEMDMYG